jgi:hypothetical protein
MRLGQQELSGSIVLSTGTAVLIRVALNLPALTRAEQRELRNVRVPLHDLTPRRVIGNVAKMEPMEVGGPLDGAEVEALAARCPVHSGMIHGGEAEELRAGIELILEGDDKGGKVRIRLQRLLDHVDARDSLSHLEGKKSAWESEKSAWAEVARLRVVALDAILAARPILSSETYERMRSEAYAAGPSADGTWRSEAYAVGPSADGT